MIDIRFLRENPSAVKKAVVNKNAAVTEHEVDQLLLLDGSRKSLLTKIEEIRRRRNELSDSLKQGKPTLEKIEEGKKYKQELSELESEYNKVDVEYLDILKRIPNIPYKDVPIGKSEDENLVSKTVGTPRVFEFEPKNHWQLAEPLGLIDKDRAAKVAGSRFAYLKGNLVKLHYAMIMFGMDVLTNETILSEIAVSAGLSGKISAKPFTLVMPPLMVKTAPYEATGRLNREEQTYKVENEDLWLNASAEHSLAPMYMDEILDQSELPVRYAGYATSFRREAGTYGKDSEGILRMHQFDKLEMESFSLGEDSFTEHLFMIAIQEYLMQSLELPYQVIMKCTADIGKPNARGVDIEAWLPGQNRYRETHSADLITDYQARRLQTRVKRTNGETELVHTNDATVFSQRPLIAIMENYQQADGSIKIPVVLQKYYGGQTL